MIVSKEASGTCLTHDELRHVIEQGLAGLSLSGKRVLVVIPDHTRSGPVGTFFRVIADALLGKAAALDFLVAMGTHDPLPEDQPEALLGLTPEERTGRYGRVGVRHHAWRSPEALRQAGTLTRAQVEELSGGRLSIDVPVLVNRLVFEYDHVIIAGPVFPHEVAGFSGGHKYLFPGIADKQVIDFTHWLGALVTNPLINGTRETPVRAAIEAAADLVPGERTLIGYVVKGDGVAGLFVGPVREAWRAATELSDRIHIVYRDRPYHTVLSCAPKMYNDIWTAGKCMYKLEPVVADGGTLIIYAPHINEVSYSHGEVIDQVGYHVRDYFVKQWERFKGFPWGVLAHSTHVRGVGTYEAGVERPRVHVVLATGIPEAHCRRINLGYLAPATVDPRDYADREGEGVLLVPKAGEILYRLKDMSRFV